MGRLVVVLLSAVLLADCASTGAVPRPFPLPAGSPKPSATDSPEPSVAGSPGTSVPGGVSRPGRDPRPRVADGYSISSTALSLRGAPYRNGGADPAGFDCSGFVKYVFEQNGVPVPRDTRSQFGLGQQVEPAALEPGDLVFFTTTAPGASHVGISVGGDQFVHAPSSNGVVRVENLSAPYWASRFVGARRVN
jgi:cell wall-associated NlpC family hydrolase